MTAPAPNPFGLSESWTLALEAERKSDRTVETYTLTIRLLATWLQANGHPHDDVRAVTPDLIRGWLTHLADTRSGETCRTRYVALHQFVKWCLAEGELDADPMANIAQPTTAPKVVPPISPDDMRALIDSCKGTDFTSLRDRAIMLVFADTGARLSGVAGLREHHVDLRERTLLIRLKGGKELLVPIGATTATALDRYLRAKRRMKYGDRDWLWLSSTNKGMFTTNGIQQMLKRRAKPLGIHVHPHLFRHTFAETWLEAGGSESDLMEIAGWKSRQMVGRYAAAGRAKRARAAHRQLSPMDNL